MIYFYQFPNFLISSKSNNFKGFVICKSIGIHNRGNELDELVYLAGITEK